MIMVMIENYFDHLVDDKALAPFLLWIWNFYKVLSSWLILNDAALTARALNNQDSQNFKPGY